MAIGNTAPKILIADHDNAARETISRVLSRVGWHVDGVASGKDAIKAMTVTNYDVVITDLVIPDLGGVDLLRQMRAQSPNQAIIVMGSYCSADSLVAVQREGAQECLLKPVDIVTLEQTIERMLSGSKSYQAGKWAEHFLSAQRVVFRFQARDLAKVTVPFGITDLFVLKEKLSRDMKLKIELALQEALTNGLDHGNLELESQWKEEVDADGNDKYARMKRARLEESEFNTRLITLEVVCDRNAMTFRVSDEGKGFDVAAVEERIERASESGHVHGRGITLIRSVMDSARYENGGRDLVMEKRWETVGKAE